MPPMQSVLTVAMPPTRGHDVPRVTRVLLISASPTPWDVEGRMSGNAMLPLTTDGEIALNSPIAVIHRVMPVPCPGAAAGMALSGA